MLLTPAEYWRILSAEHNPSVDYSADPQPVARIIHLMDVDVSNPKFNVWYLLQAELSQVSSPQCLVKEGVSISQSAYR